MGWKVARGSKVVCMIFLASITFCMWWQRQNVAAPRATLSLNGAQLGIGFSPNGDFYLSSDSVNPMLHLWNCRNGDLLHSFPSKEAVDGRAYINSAGFSKDCKYLFIEYNCAIFAVYDIASKQLLASINVRDLLFARPQFSITSDGQYLDVVVEKELRRYDLQAPVIRDTWLTVKPFHGLSGTFDVNYWHSYVGFRPPISHQSQESTFDYSDCGKFVLVEQVRLADLLFSGSDGRGRSLFRLDKSPKFLGRFPGSTIPSKKDHKEIGVFGSRQRELTKKRALIDVAAAQSLDKFYAFDEKRFIVQYSEVAPRAIVREEVTLEASRKKKVARNSLLCSLWDISSASPRMLVRFENIIEKILPDFSGQFVWEEVKRPDTIEYEPFEDFDYRQFRNLMFHDFMSDNKRRILTEIESDRGSAFAFSEDGRYGIHSMGSERMCGRNPRHFANEMIDRLNDFFHASISKINNPLTPKTRIYDMSNGSLVAEIDNAYSVHISPDGKTFATHDRDHGVQVWDLPPRRIKLPDRILNSAFPAILCTGCILIVLKGLRIIWAFRFPRRTREIHPIK